MQKYFSADINGLKMKQAIIIQVHLSNPDKNKLDKYKPVGFTPEEVLPLLVELNQNKAKCDILRQESAQAKNLDIFPSNSLLIEEKVKF